MREALVGAFIIAMIVVLVMDGDVTGNRTALPVSILGIRTIRKKWFLAEEATPISQHEVK